MRLPSLSFVLPVDRWNKAGCISSYLKEEYENALLKQADQGIQILKVSDNAILFCKRLIDAKDKRRRVREAVIHLLCICFSK
ncbi:uncharacterized protein RHIMIDRAFT_268979 [Rhizopus microsporus ATCC 52813]|uniref:Uncharacterized protein n=1 Tax=Rhizopus microsporus ATCC 52813 TaxID=1340429 RepID=A0A2G4SIH9_RHIZD|nr:uncharacterized protein RHIMIDRAFT_268979 [Rhizopus microsporus ATCC 52813]PHZ08588.1 hypothetical protein RHIMIDRAFT_268979 [Rhizopus microsporus ATCC 52813]